MSRLRPLSLTLLSLAALGRAESLPETHDGFFLSMALGGGSSTMNRESTEGLGSIKNTGTGVGLDLRIGGTVLDNLILHGTLVEDVSADPKTTVSLPDGSGSGSLYKTSSLVFLGGGLTYYIMPVNIYLSASAGKSTFMLEYKSGIEGAPSKESQSGFGAQIKVGKEWWVSPNWGLGTSGYFNYGKASPSGENDSYTGFGLQFSATFQ